jgi:hypothetical protein
MVSRYRQPALNTPNRRADRLSSWLIALIIGGVALPATASGQQAPALRPYTAQYKTTARGFDLNVTRKLEADDNNHFILTNGGKMLVVGFHEISVFRVEDDEIRSISYVYQGTGLVSRRQELHFDAEPGKITSLYKEQWYDLPDNGSTLDRMNQMEQLRLELLQDPADVLDITLQIADGKRLKNSQLVLIGEETQHTPLGPVATLHYERLHDDPERKSDIWLAPQWDYLMVRMLHIEDGKPMEMVLTSATLDGEVVGIN